MFYTKKKKHINKHDKSHEEINQKVQEENKLKI